MAINRSVDRQAVSVAETQLARVAGDGCARHPYLNALLEASGPHTGRDLSDAVASRYLGASAPTVRQLAHIGG